LGQHFKQRIGDIVIETTMKSASEKPKRKRKHGHISRAEIVTAALRIVKRDGAAALSMRTLAAELKVSTMAAYYYVPSKEALIEMVMDRVFSDIRASDFTGSPQERLHKIFWKAFHLTREHPGLLLLAAPSAASKEIQRIRNENKELFKEAGYSSRFTEVGFLLVGLFEYAAVLWADSMGATVGSDSQRNVEQDIDDCLSVIFAGLKAIGDVEHAKPQGTDDPVVTKRPQLRGRRKAQVV
jgi:AcrR family transcriptional regulator